MKKLIFIIALIFAASTFAKANISSKNAPLVSTELSAISNVKSNDIISNEFKNQVNEVQKITTGNITDSKGNVVGWWAYDDKSGVLIIYIKTPQN